MKALGLALGVGLWFTFLALPLAGLKVDYLAGTWELRGANLLWIFGGTALAYGLGQLWRTRLSRPAIAGLWSSFGVEPSLTRWLAYRPLRYFLVALLMALPLVASSYQTGVLVTLMMYMVLGLGLNVVVGIAGLLDLGYVAFYALGAYGYGLGHQYWCLSFWWALPLAGLLAALAGVVLGVPVLRLKGDYLAIVTLGFGEIIRLVLENWGEVTKGPAGVSGIPKPGLPGIRLGYEGENHLLYYLIFLLLLLSIGVNHRLVRSRLGRAWVALREDEIAAQAMGVNLTRTKLAAFAFGAFWAGMVGVFFAAKASFVNPASFTFAESAVLVCIVVLGGRGSVLGVILASLLLVLLPESMRFLQEYRMLLFGAVMVFSMVFLPQGLVKNPRPWYLKPKPEEP